MLALAWVALVALTLSSWGLAHVPLGAANDVIALVIAVAKTSVVGAVFMELLHASRTIRVVALVALSLIVLLCAGIVTDPWLR